MKNKSGFPVLGIAILFLTSPMTAQEIRLITTATTNWDTRTIRFKDIYIRDGMTNLERRTNFKDGKLRIRFQRIYRDGKLLGDVTDDKVNKVVGISAEPDRPYALTFQFYPDKTLQSVCVGTNGILVDAFTCTNGVLFPMDSSKIKKANEVGADMIDLFTPTNVHSKSSEEFNQQAEKLIEKHKDK